MKNYILTLSLACFIFLTFNLSFAQDDGTAEPSPDPVASSEADTSQVNTDNIVAEFDKLIGEYHEGDSKNKNEFTKLLQNFNKQKPSYSEFQKKWRSIANNALDFPESYPVYDTLEGLIDKLPTDSDEQYDKAKRRYKA